MFAASMPEIIAIEQEARRLGAAEERARIRDKVEELIRLYDGGPDAQEYEEEYEVAARVLRFLLDQIGEEACDD